MEGDTGVIRIFLTCPSARRWQRSRSPYLGGVEDGVVGAVHAPLGAQLQQVKQDVVAQQMGDGEAQGDPVDGAGTFVVELREDSGIMPSTGGDAGEGAEGTSPEHPQVPCPTS